MSLDAPTFRQNFPEFNDPSVYSDDVFAFWLSIATNSINPIRWGNSFDYGASLFIAHHLVLATRDQDAAEAGTEPGAVKGVLTSKAVDKVSASYDARSVAMESAGFWNMTRYGINFYRLSQMMGAGPLFTC